MIDYHGKSVLVAGGTHGVGLATALAFGRCGAHCILTQDRQRTADEAREQFRAAAAPEPLLIPSGGGTPADNCAALLREIEGRGVFPEAFVSATTGAGVIAGLSGWTERAVVQGVRAGGWPIYEYLLRMREACGRYPRYVVALSSDSPDHYSAGCDLLAASAAVLETLCRYLTYHLRHEDVHINVLRIRAARTEAFQSAFGGDFEPFARRLGQGETGVEPEEVGSTVLALCSGLLDGVRGQVITVDRGATFFDDLSWLYQRRPALGL